LLAFVGISAFAGLAAVLGIYAFRQVGERLELIDTRVPQVISSMEISRAVDRLIASAPALLAATTTKDHDEVLKRMRPEVDRLIIGLNDVARSGTAGEAAITIQSLVASLRANLRELEGLVELRLKISERLARVLQALFQANKEAERLFAPWLEVMEMQINRSLAETRKRDAEPSAQAGRDLAAAIVLDRAAQAGQRGLSAIVDQLVQAATFGQKDRLPVVEFQLRRSLDDLDAKAKELDPKLRAVFGDQVRRIRTLAVGPEAALAIRGQELDLVGNAEKLITENADLSVRLTAAVDRLVSEAETDVSSSAKDALSVQRLSAQILLSVAILSLLSSILIVWLYVNRNLIRRLMRLNDGMLGIAGGSHHRPIEISGSDEITEMGRVVEILRKNTLERDDLLVEKEHAAERLEQQVNERTLELAQSVEELRALGEVSQAVNSTIDLETVLFAIVTKATQLSATDAGTIYVFDEDSQEFRLRATYGMDETIIAEIKDRHIRMGETAIGKAVEERIPIQISDIQDDPKSVLDVIVRSGFRAVLIVPLLGADRTVGALVVRRKRVGEFPIQTVDLLQTFAAQSVLAIQNARLFESVEARTRDLAKSLEDLQAAQERLVQTEKLASLGQLTAGIAHEIKNPLNFINNFSALSVELIDELDDALKPVVLDHKKREETGELTKMLKGNLEKVVQHGKRADSIVKNMLLHSREGSGERRLVDLNSLVQESLNLAYHGARAENQEFKIRLDYNLDSAAGEVELFPQEITRVLLNLISNGFYAATKRKAEVRDGYEPALVAATRNLGDRVEISIRDNGVGIPPDVKDKMFNPFFTTKPPGEGTGLGLSLSYDIVVKQHAGSIEVDTQPGEFTEFKVVLPRKAASRPGTRT
jgi:signal transduction histidine kinase